MCVAPALREAHESSGLITDFLGKYESFCSRRHGNGAFVIGLKSSVLVIKDVELRFEVWWGVGKGPGRRLVLRWDKQVMTGKDTLNFKETDHSRCIWRVYYSNYMYM